MDIACAKMHQLLNDLQEAQAEVAHLDSIQAGNNVLQSKYKGIETLVSTVRKTAIDLLSYFQLDLRHIRRKNPRKEINVPLFSTLEDKILHCINTEVVDVAEQILAITELMVATIDKLEPPVPVFIRTRGWYLETLDETFDRQKRNAKRRKLAHRSKTNSFYEEGWKVGDHIDTGSYIFSDNRVAQIASNRFRENKEEKE